jgi:hypothetical protein
MFKFSELLKQTIKREINFIVGSVIGQITIVITMLCVYAFFYKTSIGVVNITGIVDEFVKTQSRSNLSREELREGVKVFGVSLEKTMHDISVKKHIILMPAEAVISGAEDYTQEVQERLSKITKALPREKRLLPEVSYEGKTTSSQAAYLEKQLLSQGENQELPPAIIQPQVATQGELLPKVPTN